VPTSNAADNNATAVYTTSASRAGEPSVTWHCGREPASVFGGAVVVIVVGVVVVVVAVVVVIVTKVAAPAAHRL